MKKSWILGILGLAVAMVSTFGQGCILLDNYLSSTFNPVYACSLSGGCVLAPVGCTVGLYYDPTPNENIVGSIAADPIGSASPSSLNPTLIVATGPGSTAPIIAPGYFTATASFLIQPGSTTPPQSSYTIMVVVYNGVDYFSSTMRGHSAAVYVQDVAPTATFGGNVGLFFPANTPMIGVPEPATLALAGLGGLSLWLMRRKRV